MPASWETQFRGAVAGIIEAGTAVRASTAQLWAEIHGAANEAGIPITRDAFNIVRELRSAAVARRTGYERFQRAALGRGNLGSRHDMAAWEQLHPGAFTTAFTTDHAAPDLNVRPLAVRAVQPQYLVRFDATYTNFLGETNTVTVSTKQPWQPGLTIADVVDKVREAAERMARQENGTLYGQVEGIANLRPVMI